VIAAQPTYLVAVLAGIVAYGVMSFVMTATPVSMHRMDGHDLSAAGLVIQSHVIAMFLPSLFTGSLIGWLGVRKVMASGVLAMMATAALTLAACCPTTGSPWSCWASAGISFSSAGRSC
jgi:MFS family permease